MLGFRWTTDTTERDKNSFLERAGVKKNAKKRKAASSLSTRTQSSRETTNTPGQQVSLRNQSKPTCQAITNATVMSKKTVSSFSAAPRKQAHTHNTIRNKWVAKQGRNRWLYYHVLTNVWSYRRHSRFRSVRWTSDWLDGIPRSRRRWHGIWSLWHL